METLQVLAEGGALAPTNTLRPMPQIDLSRIDVLDLYLRSQTNAATRTNYDRDLKLFFGDSYQVEQVREFLMWPPPQIRLALEAHKSKMLEAGNAGVSINRRMAAVRGLFTFAYKLGMASTPGRDLVDNERTESYRDTRGLDEAATRRLLRAPLKKHGHTERGLRDCAILRLFIYNGLRNNEMRMIDVENFDLGERTIRLIRKRSGNELKSIDVDAATLEAIEAYRRVAGHTAGALFRNVDRNPNFNRQRLTNKGIWKIVRSYLSEAQVKRLHPHRLRHTAITAVAKANKGDVVETMDFSNHKDPRVVMRYIHNAQDHQRAATNRLVSLFDSDEEPATPRKRGRPKTKTE